MAKILIADDDPEVLAIASRVLIRAGHTVNELVSQDFLTMLALEWPCPDIIILDREWYGQDLGWSLANQLHEAGFKGKILAWSGTFTAEDIAKPPYGDMAIGKPFDITELRNAINSLLAQAKSGEQGGGQC